MHGENEHVRANTSRHVRIREYKKRPFPARPKTKGTWDEGHQIGMFSFRCKWETSSGRGEKSKEAEGKKRKKRRPIDRPLDAF